MNTVSEIAMFAEKFDKEWKAREVEGARAQAAVILGINNPSCAYDTLEAITPEKHPRHAEKA